MCTGRIFASYANIVMVFFVNLWPDKNCGVLRGQTESCGADGTANVFTMNDNRL